MGRVFATKNVGDSREMLLQRSCHQHQYPYYLTLLIKHVETVKRKVRDEDKNLLGGLDKVRYTREGIEALIKQAEIDQDADQFVVSMKVKSSATLNFFKYFFRLLPSDGGCHIYKSEYLFHLQLVFFDIFSIIFK